MQGRSERWPRNDKTVLERGEMMRRSERWRGGTGCRILRCFLQKWWCGCWDRPTIDSFSWWEKIQAPAGKSGRLLAAGSYQLHLLIHLFHCVLFCFRVCPSCLSPCGPVGLGDFPCPPFLSPGLSLGEQGCARVVLLSHFPLEVDFFPVAVKKFIILNEVYLKGI